MSSEPTETIQLSTGTWMKVVGVLVVHTAVIVGTALAVVNRLDVRLTRVETNQEILLEEWKRRAK